MDDLVTRLWDHLGTQWSELRRAVAFWSPTSDAPAWMAPALALTALFGLALAAGVALLSMGVLLTALLAAHLLLTAVFGVQVAVVLPR